MLIVVEDGDVQRLPQAPFDLEASGSRDVLEVHAPEAWSDQLDGSNDLVGVRGVQADRPGIDAGELLEQGGLTFHHRHGRLGSDVSQAEDGGTVGHHRDRVSLDGQIASVGRVLVDGHTYPGHTGGVGAGEIGAVPQRHFEVHGDLAAEVNQESRVADLLHRASVELVQLVAH